MRLYERIALAAQHVQHRTLVQNHWSRKDAYDRTCVCLLRAFGPDINDPANCPVELMPEWLARLLPLINDGMPAVFYYDFAADFVGSAQHWATFQPSEWARIRSAMLLEIVWHANALVETGDQEAGYVFREKPRGRKHLDALAEIASMETVVSGSIQ